MHLELEAKKFTNSNGLQPNSNGLYWQDVSLCDVKILRLPRHDTSVSMPRAERIWIYALGTDQMWATSSARTTCTCSLSPCRAPKCHASSLSTFVSSTSLLFLQTSRKKGRKEGRKVKYSLLLGWSLWLVETKQKKERKKGLNDLLDQGEALYPSPMPTWNQTRNQMQKKHGTRGLQVIPHHTRSCYDAQSAINITT